MICIIPHDIRDTWDDIQEASIVTILEQSYLISLDNDCFENFRCFLMRIPGQTIFSRQIE